MEREALLTDGNGQTYLSPDGGQTWMTEDRYHAQYDSGWDVEWWTCEEYKVWLDREREQLQSLIGERACTGSEGWFVWDQKRADETVALYEQILEDMQNGGLYSREIRDSDGRPVPDAVLSSGGGVFSCEDLYAEEGLRVSVLYDGDGALAGLTAAQDAGEDG